MKYMTGFEALGLLKQGKKVRKNTWVKRDYIYLDKKNNSIKNNDGEYYPEANEIRYYLNDEVWEEYNIKVVDKWLNPTVYTDGTFKCECPLCHKITTTTNVFPSIIYYCMYCGTKNIVEE